MCIAAAAMRYEKGPTRGICIPPQASGRAQRASTLAKTKSVLNPPAIARSGSPGSDRSHHSFRRSANKCLCHCTCGLGNVRPWQVSHRTSSSRTAADPNFAQTEFSEVRNGPGSTPTGFLGSELFPYLPGSSVSAQSESYTFSIPSALR
jgi:hypothetical protein